MYFMRNQFDDSFDHGFRDSGSSTRNYTLSLRLLNKPRHLRPSVDPNISATCLITRLSAQGSPQVIQWQTAPYIRHSTGAEVMFFLDSSKTQGTASG